MGTQRTADIGSQTEEFLKYARSRKYSEETIRQYDYTMRALVSFLADKQILRTQEVTEEHLKDFHGHLQAKGLSLGSQENLLRITRKFFRWLESSGRLFADPTTALIIPKRGRNQILVPTEDEMIRLLAQPDTNRPIGIRDRTLLEMAYGCGLRRSELVNLSVRDPDPEHGTLRVRGKGGKERVVPMGKQALHWLNVYLQKARVRLLKGRQDVERLWVSENGRPMGGCNLYQQVRWYVAQAGITTRIGLHSLRKACATHMLSHGAHPVQIQMLLGHANLKHLGRYLKVTVQDMKKTHSKCNPGR